MTGLLGFYILVAVVNGAVIFPWFVEQTIVEGRDLGTPGRDLERISLRATWRTYALAGAMWPAVVVVYATMRLLSKFDRSEG